MNLRTLLMLLLPLIALTSCKDMVRGKELAEAAIVDFHRQFNEGKFKELYAAGHEDLKNATTEEDFVKLLEAINRKLGKHVKSTEAGWRVNSFNLKTVAVLTQKTEFEHGKGTETFSYIISGESCVLLSYYMQSNDMMMK
jgi:hypothetical protein